MGGVDGQTATEPMLIHVLLLVLPPGSRDCAVPVENVVRLRPVRRLQCCA